MNAELIAALRWCIVDFNSTQSRRCNECPYRIYADGKKACENKAKRDAADALEADEKRIARLEEDLKTREAEREVMQDTIKICEEAADRYQAQIPKEGEWIYTPLERYKEYKVKCPFCGAEYHDCYDGYIDAEDMNYCPNCGARMRKGELL